jgi:ribosomal protein S3
MKYLLNNYFTHVFNDVGLKGFKVVLKGKISAAGNSRKRSIRYRIGETSYSKVGLRVVNNFQTINTFTGVMGFNVWLFF